MFQREELSELQIEMNSFSIKFLKSIMPLATSRPFKQLLLPESFHFHLILQWWTHKKKICVIKVRTVPISIPVKNIATIKPLVIETPPVIGRPSHSRSATNRLFFLHSSLTLAVPPRMGPSIPELCPKSGIQWIGAIHKKHLSQNNKTI